VPWIVYLIDLFVPGSGSVIGHGIVPRTWFGLEGIPTAPLIHADLTHLITNTGPLIVLGALVLLRGVGEFVFVALTSGIVAGAGTWLLGAPGTHHIGASGIVFGLFGYLLLRTAFDRRWSSAVITLIVAAAYGTAILYSLIPHATVSWSGHFFGFFGGGVAARLRYHR
jgi:membrane associated rhomboid family serine protease